MLRSRTSQSNREAFTSLARLRKKLGRFLAVMPGKAKTAATRLPLAVPPHPDAHRFVFLVGLHRSGTSLIHRILRRHPLVTGFAGTPAREDEGQFLQTLLPVGRDFGGPGRFAFAEGAHFTADDPRATPESRDALLCQWGAWLDLDKPIIIEKSPPNLLRTTFLQELFPSATFVVIVRHPIPVGLATAKWSKTSLAELLLHWAVAHELAIRDLGALRRVAVLRYEDFIAAPQARMDRICDFIGIDRMAIDEAVGDHNERYFANVAAREDGFRSIFNLDDGIFETFGYSLEPPFIDMDWRWPGDRA